MGSDLLKYRVSKAAKVTGSAENFIARRIVTVTQHSVPLEQVLNSEKEKTNDESI